MSKRILLVDPEDLLYRALAEQLTANGYTVTRVDQAPAALGLPCDHTDVVLIDAKLADPAGLLEVLRGAGWTQPIIVVGEQPHQRPALHAAGASECIARPFRIARLLGRLEALLRDGQGDAGIAIGAFRFLPLARLIIDRAGQQRRLTEKEAAILAYLHHAGERPVPRDELLGEVWGYASAASTHTVETHIYRLRRKLEADAGGSPLLRTEEGGYRLAPPLQRQA